MTRTPALSRRSLLQLTATLPAVARKAPAQTPKRRVAVIGAGAFGGWTALHLLRRGYQVTLLDSYGPGNSRASSGGESRVIRGSYGANAIYTQLVARALFLWRENQERWRTHLLHQAGALFMAPEETDEQRASMKALREAGLPFEQLDHAAASRRFPQFNFEGRRSMIYERHAGYLTARRACEAVLEGFVKEGGQYRGLTVKPGAIEGRAMKGITLSDGSVLQADQYLFACGPWLSRLFPKELPDTIKPARQLVLFFGIPAGGEPFQEQNCPVWLDAGSYYGIPGNNFRGMKIVGGTLEEEYNPEHPWDPDHSDRAAGTESFKAPREYLAFRFPALKGAPLVESRVCQYENSPDGHYILDRLPGCDNVWIAGGGSGHGFKACPAVGELMADLVSGKKAVVPFFGLARFAAGQKRG